MHWDPWLINKLIVRRAIKCHPTGLMVQNGNSATIQPHLQHFTKICSEGGFTYTIREILAKDELNIANLMQTLKLFSQNYSTEFLDTAHNSWICVIKVCSNGDATCIINKIILKYNLKIVNLMQNYPKKFFDTAPWICVIKIPVCSNGGATYILDKIMAKDI